ncbi:hypothetical protein HR45_08095 [Shewanella mangrovi]|uniref:LysM domain-containing protein n=1 Tax=Shewanella mangrovi TaxID=1515746 RepID=A0A094JF25_9GAMM|nr:hypothetical protein [Shewanella mangrovi]KFZ37807.1 hypothetical protein HR45_08095 [Shewanella mangrovi]
MKSQVNLLSSIIVAVVMLFNNCWADTSHVSINQRLFDLGKIPLLKLNIVSDATDTDRFQFILQQQAGAERLMVDRINDFMYLLQGVDEVTDPKAQLLVKEYRQQVWVEVATLPLFADGVPVGNPPAGKKLSLYRDVNGSDATTEVIATPKVNTTTAVKSAAAEAAIQSASAKAKLPELQQRCLLEYDGKQTLWRLASRYAKEWHTNIYAAALGILEANPQAFYQGNPASLRSDAKLRCPSESILAQYADKTVAEKKFDALL